MEGLWHHRRGQIRSVEGRFSPDPVARTFISSLPYIFVSPDAPFFFPSPSRPVLLADSFSWQRCSTIRLEWLDGGSPTPPTRPDPAGRMLFITGSCRIRWRGHSFICCVLFFSYKSTILLPFFLPTAARRFLFV
jgi:hypothetical protein